MVVTKRKILAQVTKTISLIVEKLADLLVLFVAGPLVGGVVVVAGDDDVVRVTLFAPEILEDGHRTASRWRSDGGDNRNWGRCYDFVMILQKKFSEKLATSTQTMYSRFRRKKLSKH
jgi:hypothetical protein